MKDNIAVVGTAESSMHTAPYDDPSFEIWGLFSGIEHMPRADVIFEMHEWSLWTEAERQFGARIKLPVVLREKRPEIATSESYPFDEVWLAHDGAGLWTSSIAYMLALALYRGATTIGIYGVDVMTDGEYAHQRPAIEYLIGYGRGLGRRIIVPEQSALCKSGYVYGLAQGGVPARRSAGLDESFLRGRLDRINVEKAQTEEQMNMLAAKVHTLDGARQNTEMMISYLHHYERGGVLPNGGGA